MNRWEIATIVTMVTATALLIGWDIYIALTGPRTGRTVSKILREIGTTDLILGLPFGWGALGGHFFGPFMPYELPAWVSVGGLLAAAGALGLSGLVFEVSRKARGWLSFVCLLAGAVAGAMVWPI